MIKKLLLTIAYQLFSQACTLPAARPPGKKTARVPLPGRRAVAFVVAGGLHRHRALYSSSGGSGSFSLAYTLKLESFLVPHDSGGGA